MCSSVLGVRPSGRVCGQVREGPGCAAEWERGQGVRLSGREAGVCGRVSGWVGGDTAECVLGEGGRGGGPHGVRIYGGKVHK